jgi:D-alanine-D-alanine ligase
MGRMKVAVLSGGRSAEREVSLSSGRQVAAALAESGHETEMVDLDRECWERLRDGGFDCVFIALHGRLGEDGTVQGMLELLDLPYTGSGVLASALCIDKTRSNQLLAQDGLLVPEFEEVDGRQRDPTWSEGLVARYGLPLVIKPVREGSTIGLTIAADEDQVATGLVEAARYDHRVMVQHFVAGTEITIGVLATPELEVLPTLEILYGRDVYDYTAKYTAGESEHVIPARISQLASERACAAAARAVRALGCEGMARVDFIVDETDQPWLLEVNTIPGLTELSLLPDAARAAGVSFAEVCDRLVRHGVERSRSGVGP